VEALIKKEDGKIQEKIRKVGEKIIETESEIRAKVKRVS
jgi:hypothetical protein